MLIPACERILQSMNEEQLKIVRDNKNKFEDCLKVINQIKNLDSRLKRYVSHEQV